MELNDKTIKRLSILFLMMALAVLVFFLVEPIISAILWGLILAYTFFPVYERTLLLTKRKNLSATIVSLIVLILIIVPLYFLIPLMVRQTFEIFKYVQALDMQNVIKAIFPSAPESFLIQVSLTLNSLISKISSAVLNLMTDFLLEVPTFIFNAVIVAFVFFFALRDSDKLKEFASSISPFNKAHEKKLVNQFKDITNSIIYGYVVAGIVQGITAGLGLFVFGIPNALVLTILAVTLSVIPVLGPYIIWVPVAIYLFFKGSMSIAVIYLLYNIIIVTNIDNLIRIYFVSKKAKLSQVIVLIGMAGGLFVFGLLGLIIGPLLVAYFLTFLQAYRENTFSALFKTEQE